ncbi:MAG: SIMPL domain-containing protein [Candidatus Kapaibacterium sp.]
MTRHFITAIALAFLVSPVSTLAQPTPPQPERRTITVTGEAEMTMSPDRATVTIGVETWGKNIMSIKADNGKRVKAILDAVKGLGIPAKDIMTQEMSLLPEYSWKDDHREFLRYRMRNVVVITVNDLAKVEDVVNAGVNESSNVLEGVAFSTKDASRLRDSLQIQAARNARAKAVALAEAVGAKVGDAVTITESQTYEPQPFYGRRAMALDMKESAPTPVESGQLTLKSTINIVFELR